MWSNTAVKKEKIEKDIVAKYEKFLRAVLYTVTGINQWEVAVARYSGGIVTVHV